MSANRVTITDGYLVVEPLGLDKIWSFKRRIRIPRAHVVSASIDEGAIRESKGFRFPGLLIPGKAAGTFYAKGKRQFWNVAGQGEAVVIELAAAEHFDRLILSIDDPRVVVDALTR